MRRGRRRTVVSHQTINGGCVCACVGPLSPHRHPPTRPGTRFCVESLFEHTWLFVLVESVCVCGVIGCVSVCVRSARADSRVMTYILVSSALYAKKNYKKCKGKKRRKKEKKTNKTDVGDANVNLRQCTRYFFHSFIHSFFLFIHFLHSKRRHKMKNTTALEWRGEDRQRRPKETPATTTTPAPSLPPPTKYSPQRKRRTKKTQGKKRV